MPTLTLSKEHRLRRLRLRQMRKLAWAPAAVALLAASCGGAPATVQTAAPSAEAAAAASAQSPPQSAAPSASAAPSVQGPSSASVEATVQPASPQALSFDRITSIVLPTGWRVTTSTGFLAAAKNDTDLSAPVPSGPRLMVVLVPDAPAPSSSAS